MHDRVQTHVDEFENVWSVFGVYFLIIQRPHLKRKRLKSPLSGSRLCIALNVFPQEGTVICCLLLTEHVEILWIWITWRESLGMHNNHMLWPGLRLCSSNPPYNTKEAVSAVCSLWPENPGLVWNGRPQKGKKKKKKMLFEFYPICCGHGNCLLWLASPVWGCVPSCRQRKSRGKEAGWLPAHWFPKNRLFAKRGEAIQKMLNGLSNRTECACATPTTPKKSQHGNLPLSSHRDEMKNQHTVKNGLSSFSRAGSHHPFRLSVSPLG